MKNEIKACLLCLAAGLIGVGCLVAAAAWVTGEVVRFVVGVAMLAM